MVVELDSENLHPATVLMIEALHWLHERYAAENLLDMGCGSGILSALSASIWDARVLAADISPKAVEDTTKNIAAHGLENRVSVVQSDGFLSPEIAARAPYDLILINLLAEPIVSWATKVKSLLSNNGIISLGGILAWQAEGVKQAYSGLGFEMIEEFVSEPWHLLILRHPVFTQP